MHQGFQKPAEQFFQIARLELDTKQLIKRLGFGLPHLVIGIIQGQDDAEVELLADPLEVCVFLRQQRYQERRQQPVIFLERFKDGAGRQIQLGQAAAVILDLFDEMQGRFSLRKNARRSARRDVSQGDSLLRFKAKLTQAAQKLAV